MSVGVLGVFDERKRLAHKAKCYGCMHVLQLLAMQAMLGVATCQS
jgi:hypothetical protein